MKLRMSLVSPLVPLNSTPSQIYGKLGVRNRVTAVARARELNLIDNE